MLHIIKAEENYFIPGNHDIKPAELVVVLHWRDKQTGMPRFTGENMPEGMASKKYSTPAYISHGRWVADCQGPGCFAAVVVSPNDMRMWCPNCENEYVDGKWIRVDWPRDWQAREEVMLERPLLENRSALPHETLRGLKQENQENLFS
jgi:hypothetical protein